MEFLRHQRLAWFWLLSIGFVMAPWTKSSLTLFIPGTVLQLTRWLVDRLAFIGTGFSFHLLLPVRAGALENGE